ncbi:MAG: glutamine--fructose-6-phosphate transaminase (isomerizing) [Chitinophagales bacterium]|jgi:glucosamine--fructose-6-phosphate aminotransferase (isomerizing)|nr:glutamine--fructose-6-phosphate transaminase (isomerizing) [Chitinophagales bacterium]
MCGIVGYMGFRQAYPIVIKGLRRLEYRGYDSAGIAIYDNQALKIYKNKGKVDDLEAIIPDEFRLGHLAIGHTRWATHGEPNQVNAHPHANAEATISVIHNGIIENYQTLKSELINRGYAFKSETDTEVLVHLIEDVLKNQQCSLKEAVRLALNEVTGAYAICVISSLHPGEMIGARKGSPLLLGLGENEFFLASDASPLVEYTKKIIYLNEFEIVELKSNGDFQIFSLENDIISPYIQELSIKLEMIEKGGFDFFMHKEIYEQPKSILDSVRGRIDANLGIIKLAGLEEYRNKLLNSKRIIIMACGTSWHAALIAEYLIEDLARINVEVEYASEFRYRNPVLYPEDVIIAISQSGETADTLAAIDMAKQKGCLILGVCNVVGSSIPRASDAGCYTHAGPEIGVASTKAFTAQLSVLTLMALWLADQKGTLTKQKITEILVQLEGLPDKIQEILPDLDLQTQEIAKDFYESKNFLFLGRGYNFPSALEGALKLKEISYIHAEGYPAAEMKHGPIALIDEQMPVVFVANNMSLKDKLVSNMQEVAARKGKIISISIENETEIKNLSTHFIALPEIHEVLTPILSAIPMQLLAYHIALLRGCNVDQPRNLAKSVTVE